MTTTSSDNGASAADGDGGDSGRGWFTPARERTHTPARDAGAPEQRQSVRPVGSPAGREPGGPAQPEPDGRSGPEPEPMHEPLAVRATGSAKPPSPQSPAAQPPPAGHGAPHEAAAAASVRQPSRDAALIQRTMEEVEPQAHALTAYFYALLFVQHPQLRDLFPASMDVQRDRLFRALLTAVQLVDEKERLREYLSALGRGHRKYGTLPEHYPAVGECLIGALTQYATQTWDDETEAAWVRAYTEISQIMIDSAAEDELRAPAWWNAEIVAHERRTPHIAVITVRPDQPYPFRAGQYTSIETPWWPRVWRHYSFASSPRSDGLLTFHVKSVPAGWVSTALVQRARVGDMLKLGPPAGSMTVDHSSASGLLCLGGGTGIAPIKALIQDVADRDGNRPVEVFYGARNDHDLYDLDNMLRLAQRNSWLTVRPVVAEGSRRETDQVLSGQLTDAVRELGPWSAYDGYLSGPPGMIRSGVEALVGSGIPAHRIRHDSIEELVVTGD